MSAPSFSQKMQFLLFVTFFVSVFCEKNCDEVQQKQMQEEFQTCLAKFTQQHHEASGKAKTDLEYQTATCQMLKDTVDCGNLWHRCHAALEVRAMKDSYISARMQQLSNSRVGLDVNKCAVVREYVDSGRADEKANEGERCTYAEVTEVQTDFQKCSYNLSGDVWSEIQDLKDARLTDLRKKANAHQGQHQPEQDDAAAVLNMDREVKPLFCKTLDEINKRCTAKFDKCFNKEDGDQMRLQHLEQLKKYFSGMYPGLDLSNCAKGDHAYKESSSSSSKPTKESSTSSKPAKAEDEEEEESTEEESNHYEVDEDEYDQLNFGNDFKDPKPFLDYDGETNDIAGPKDVVARSDAAYFNATSTTTSTTTTRSTSSRTSSGKNAADSGDDKNEDEKGHGNGFHAKEQVHNAHAHSGGSGQAASFWAVLATVLLATLVTGRSRP